MAADTEMVNVFRSVDSDAEETARTLQELLTAQGIAAVLLDDSAPEVPSGAWEVQVPAADAGRAEQLVAEERSSAEDMGNVSQSAAFDAETVFRAHSSTSAQFEAMSVKSMLEASGIAAILVGDSVLPNLSFEVQVAKEQADEARRLIADAQTVGSDAADDEEQSTETPLNP